MVGSTRSSPVVHGVVFIIHVNRQSTFKLLFDGLLFFGFRFVKTEIGYVKQVCFVFVYFVWIGLLVYKFLVGVHF